MASTIKLLVTQMEEMETSFLSIFFEAANKIAHLTESKLFFLMETSEGIRRIGGNPELKSTFQLGLLAPRPSDVLIRESYDPPPNESPPENYQTPEVNHSRKRKAGRARPEASSSAPKYARPETIKTSNEVECEMENVKLDMDAVQDTSERDWTDESGAQQNEDWGEENDQDDQSVSDEEQLDKGPRSEGKENPSGENAEADPDWEMVAPGRKGSSRTSHVWKYFSLDKNNTGTIKDKCVQCGHTISFGDSIKLRLHLRKEHGMRDVDDATLAKSFERRIAHEHTKSKCNLCHKAYNCSTASLRYHLRKVHGIDLGDLKLRDFQ